MLGPEQWSKARFNKWIESLENGKYAKLACTKYSGKLKSGAGRDLQLVSQGNCLRLSTGVTSRRT